MFGGIWPGILTKRAQSKSGGASKGSSLTLTCSEISLTYVNISVLAKIVSGLPPAGLQSSVGHFDPHASHFSQFTSGKYWILLDKMSGKVKAGHQQNFAGHVRHISRGLHIYTWLINICKQTYTWLIEISHVLMETSHVYVCLHMLMRFHYKLE